MHLIGSKSAKDLDELGKRFASRHLSSSTNAGLLPLCTRTSLCSAAASSGPAWLRARRVQVLQLPPSPASFQDLRTTLYPRLVPVANRWNVRYGDRGSLSGAPLKSSSGGRSPCRPAAPNAIAASVRLPETSTACIRTVYGEHVFPLQVAVLLSEPEKGLHRWRIRTHRAKASDAIAGGGDFLCIRATGWHSRFIIVLFKERGEPIVSTFDMG